MRLLTIHCQHFAGSISSSIADSTLVIPWLSPSHSKCVSVFSFLFVSKYLREGIFAIRNIYYSQTISYPVDSRSRTTSGGTGYIEHWK